MGLRRTHMHAETISHSLSHFFKPLQMAVIMTSRMQTLNLWEGESTVETSPVNFCDYITLNTFSLRKAENKL